MNVQKRITDAVPVLGSSVDSDKVAATVKGAIIASATLIIAGFGFLGVTVELGDVTTIANSLQNVIAALGVVYGSGLTIFGLIRKIANKNR